MKYELSVPFTGAINTALSIARAQFTANGFKVNQPGETELNAIGPGMHSTNQNPILGVTRARITVSANAIHLYAELGGVRFMQMFAYIFPPALVSFLALIFVFAPHGPRHFPPAAFLIILPWLVISPLMAKWIKTRTTKAIDTMVYNMANSR